jgi:opacity protein-like surface antigen
MKKMIAAFALATAGFITLPASAQTAGGNYQPSQPVGSSNWFIRGGVGEGHMADAPYGNHPTSYDLSGGYRVKVGPDLGFGIELGYNHMGTTQWKVGNPSAPFTKRQDMHGWTAGFNGRINLWQGLYWSGRAGAYAWEAHGYNDQFDRKHQSGTSWYVGTGVGYDFNERFSLGLAYDYYKADMSRDYGVRSTDSLSVSAEYRF